MTAIDLEQQFADRWPKERLERARVVLAVSGGADSIAMLRAAIRICGNDATLLVGHVHHGLRGEAADRAARFVEQTCQRLGVSCCVGRVDASNQGDGVESAARDARYDWLTQLAKSHSAAYLATAHTADDQVETIVHRILRGTGLAGLAGIPATRSMSEGVTLIRPLIDCTRCQVEAYLEMLRQPSSEDETNRDTELTRNRIRHKLLPLVEQAYNPQVRKAILRLGSLAGEAQEWIDAAVVEMYRASCIATGSSRAIVKPETLLAVPPFAIRELLIHVWKTQAWPLQAMGYDEWQRLVDMLADSAAQPQMFPGSVRAEKQGGQLVLTRPVES